MGNLPKHSQKNCFLQCSSKSQLPLKSLRWTTLSKSKLTIQPSSNLLFTNYLGKVATGDAFEGMQMGTITSGLFLYQTSGNPRISLKNYLGKMGNPKLSKNQKENYKLDKSNYHVGKSGYKFQSYGLVNGKFIFVCEEPRYFNPKMPYYKITWHQSQWKDQKEVADTFIELFGLQLTKSILTIGKLSQVDVWLDTECQLETLRNSFFRKGIVRKDNMDTKRRSVYYGSRKPLSAIVYEKKRSGNEKIDIKTKSKNKSDYYTRIKARMFGKAVPIKTYADYAKLGEMSLFDFLSVYYLPCKKLSDLIKETTTDTKTRNFLESIQRNSLQFARQRFNQNRDFYRKLEPFLKKNTKNLYLSKRWRKKVKSSIVKDFDLRKYLNEYKPKPDFKKDNYNFQKFKAEQYFITTMKSNQMISPYSEFNNEIQ